MMNMQLAAAFLAAALFVAGAAAAQERPAISLTPAESAQWDIAGHVGWLASHKPDITAEWYDVLSGGVSAGRYLTPHLKTEIHAVMAREGRMYSQDPVLLTAPFPVFRSREHTFQTASVGAGVSYQFFENQWFHPFVGGGLEVLREHHRVRVPEQFLPQRAPGVPAVTLPAVSFAPEVSYAARPFVTTGFKWYVAERAFLRTSIQASFSRRGTTHVVWAAGIGADL
jgi:opacity protein-like surface antigen